MSNLGIVPEEDSSTQVTLYLSDESSVALYLCNFCLKTFYNANALQNHKNSQHDIEDFNDVEHQISPEIIGLQDDCLNHSIDYNFILSESSNKENNVTVEDKLTNSSQDAIYLGADGVVKKSPKKGKPIHLSGPFVCSFPSTVDPDIQCRQSFVDCCDYSLHYHEKHTKPCKRKDLRCQVCEKQLATKKDRDNSALLLEAQLNTKSPLKIYWEYCGKMLSKCSEYNEYISKKHVQAKPHQCATCSKRFVHKRGLQLHMGIHAGIRPFSCTYCPKTFIQKSGLNQHLLTHAKIKPFECVICKKQYSQLVHLHQHMRTHTNIQPFKCVVCEKKFKQRTNLNYHMRKHFTDISSSLLEQNTQAMPNDILVELI